MNQTEIGRCRLYSEEYLDRDDVVIWDVLQIQNTQTIEVKFISKHSTYDQGIRLAIDAGQKGFFELTNAPPVKEIYLWWSGSPRKQTLVCHASEGLLSVFNMYDKGHGFRFHSYKCGMLLEQHGHTTTYHCNDYGETEEFDKLVFSIKLI